MTGAVKRNGRVASAGAAPASNKPSIFADDMVAPLLSKDGTGTIATSVNSDEREQVMEEVSLIGGDLARPTAAQMFKWMVALLISAAGAVASVASCILSPAIIVYVAGGLCVMNSPMVAYNESKILRIPSRKQAVEELEATAGLLKKEADLLEEEIEFLLGHASRFAEAEQELQDMAREYGFDVGELVKLIRLNEETMDLMRENLRQKVIQDVIEIVIRSEKESYQIIDRVEAKLLALKITVKLEAYGITFDEDKFLEAVALNPTLWGIAGTVRKLLPPWDEDQIDDTYTVQSGGYDVYDMFYMSVDDRQRTGPALAAADSVSLAKRGRHVPSARAG